MNENPPYILIVNDDNASFQYMKTLLEFESYEIKQASSAAQTIEFMKKNPPDLILLDIDMPGKDGLVLCQHIRKVEKWVKIPIIVITSFDDRGEKLRALGSGVQDFIVRPVDAVELWARIASLLRIKFLYDRLEHQNRKLKEEIEKRKEAESALFKARQKEMEMGSKIQKSLLWGQIPTAFDSAQIFALSIPSQFIDGDFYDFFVHQQHILDVIVGDVMGKGIHAALIGAGIKKHILQATAKLLPSHFPKVEEIITAVHGKVTKELVNLQKFVTLCYARFDFKQQKMLLVDCAHTRTIYFNHREKKCKLLEGKNGPLGVREDEVYQEICVPFAAKDVFVFYSDGVIESQDVNEELFGEDRLLEFIAANYHLKPNVLIGKLLEAVYEFSGSKSFPDDLTCVAISIV